MYMSGSWFWLQTRISGGTVSTEIPAEVFTHSLEFFTIWQPQGCWTSCMELSFHTNVPVNKVEVALIFMTQFWKTQSNSSAVFFCSKLSHTCEDSWGDDIDHHLLLGWVSKNFVGMFLKYDSFVVHLTYHPLSSWRIPPVTFCFTVLLSKSQFISKSRC